MTKKLLLNSPNLKSFSCLRRDLPFARLLITFVPYQQQGEALHGTLDLHLEVKGEKCKKKTTSPITSKIGLSSSRLCLDDMEKTRMNACPIG